MLTLAKVFEYQAKYGVGSVLSNTDAVTYENYLNRCKVSLKDRTPAEYYSWNKKKQNDYTNSLIIQFVQHNLQQVEGFIDVNGELEQDKLMNRLMTDIADFGILKAALEDEKIQEIQINDYKTIWVVKGGQSELYVDDRGKPYQFTSNEELHATIDRLVYSPTEASPRMTKQNPLINTRTASKGYRLSGVNDTAITPDLEFGFDFPVTSITIRKYSKSELGFEEFEKFGSMCSPMSRLLRLAGPSNIRLFCVGATSSGKTTLLQGIVKELPKELRAILIQNPTEVMLYERDPSTGANTRNALHWEASEVDERLRNSATTPTMDNFIAHSLRNTPDIIIPGEIRTPPEFFQAYRAITTGHRVFTTFHAEDGIDACKRFASELSAIGGSETEALRNIATSVDLIIVQKRYPDGGRKVTEITELTGKVDIETGLPETNILYRYRTIGKSDRDPVTKRVKHIYGYFERVNPISDNLKQKLYDAGFNKEEVEEFTKPVEIVEEGSNIQEEVLLRGNKGVF